MRNRVAVVPHDFFALSGDMEEFVDHGTVADFVGFSFGADEQVTRFLRDERFEPVRGRDVEQERASPEEQRSRNDYREPKPEEPLCSGFRHASSGHTDRCDKCGQEGAGNDDDGWERCQME